MTQTYTLRELVKVAPEAGAKALHNMWWEYSDDTEYWLNKDVPQSFKSFIGRIYGYGIAYDKMYRGLMIDIERVRRGINAYDEFLEIFNECAVRSFFDLAKDCVTAIKMWAEKTQLTGEHTLGEVIDDFDKACDGDGYIGGYFYGLAYDDEAMFDYADSCCRTYTIDGERAD